MIAPPPRARAALAAAAVLAGAAALASFALRHALALRAGWPREAAELYLPGATALRLASLGHRELAADLVAARANVYFGSELASRGEQRWLARYLETAADLDPRFHRLYLRGAAMLVYNGRAFTADALLAANHLLERGAREFPSDWELPFQLGFNLFYELPKLAGEDDARVPAWRERGVEALRQAARLDGSPPWLPGLVARMLTAEGGEELAIRHLEETYALTSNPETRRQIARKLATLEAGRAAAHTAARLAEEAAALEALVAARYPYAPEAFSLAAGPRPPAAVDLDALLGLDARPPLDKPAGGR